MAGNQLVVNAFAGTGKTATLVQFAQTNPDSKMLYLAYNRAIRDEAEQKFPSTLSANFPSTGSVAFRPTFQTPADSKSANYRCGP